MAPIPKGDSPTPKPQGHVTTPAPPSPRPEAQATPQSTAHPAQRWARSAERSAGTGEPWLPCPRGILRGHSAVSCLLHKHVQRPQECPPQFSGRLPEATRPAIKSKDKMVLKAPKPRISQEMPENRGYLPSQRERTRTPFLGM